MDQQEPQRSRGLHIPCAQENCENPREGTGRAYCAEHKPAPPVPSEAEFDAQMVRQRLFSAAMAGDARACIYWLENFGPKKKPEPVPQTVGPLGSFLHGLKEGLKGLVDEDEDDARETHTCECGDQIRTAGPMRDQGWGYDQDGCTVCAGCCKAIIESWPTGLGDRIYYLRESHEMTLEELAERANIDRVYLGCLQRGEVQDPSASQIRRLARALNVRMDDLLGPEPQEERPYFSTCRKCQCTMETGSGVSWDNDVGETIEVCQPCHFLLQDGER